MNDSLKNPENNLSVIVLGTRGFPDVQGGVETHAEELYPRLVNLGADVTVVTRTPYIAPEDRLSEFKNVKFAHIYAPKLKSLEAIVHTFLGILYARWKSPDVVHIHAVGPNLLTPLARLLGLRVVMTNHGPDYDRQKWGKLAKFVLRMGEKAGSVFSNEVIIISEVIRTIIREKHGRQESHLVYNGVNLPEHSTTTDYIDSLGLQPGKFAIGVGRFVEEKGFHDLIEAWKRLDTDWKLVIAGDADHETDYSRKLKEMARENGVVLTGFIKGESLRQIFSHAGLFVMPSYHEGLPIALLEAMSYNLDLLVSDIPANLEVKLPDSDYFSTGNVTELTQALSAKMKSLQKRDFRELIVNKYNWDRVAVQTLAVYQKAVS